LEKKLFLKRTKMTVDLDRVGADLERILTQCKWGDRNQIGLRYRSGAKDRWSDAVGSLYDRTTNTKLSSEIEFNQWTISNDYYVRQSIDVLSERVGQIGRVRFMRLLPKTGLSVHRDDEIRFHLVLKTNPNAYIARASDFVIEQNSPESVVATCYHIPADGHWWRVDTREVHWVYNGGNEERIHLVVCGV
jgi:hypothetical protein